MFNPGATLLADGTTLLLCRVEDRRGHSHLCAARSANGTDHWELDSKPTFKADPEHYPDELWGIEDPRITYLPELGQYAIAYTAYASGGSGVALALTKDFHCASTMARQIPVSPWPQAAPGPCCNEWLEERG